MHAPMRGLVFYNWAIITLGLYTLHQHSTDFSGWQQSVEVLTRTQTDTQTDSLENITPEWCGQIGADMRRGSKDKVTGAEVRGSAEQGAI